MMFNGVSNYSIFYDKREDPTILNTTTYIFWPTKIIKNHSMPNVRENVRNEIVPLGFSVHAFYLGEHSFLCFDIKRSTARA